MLRELMNRLLSFGGASVPGDAVAARVIADRLIAAGNRAENDGTLSEACERYHAAVKTAPRYSQAHLNLGIGLEAAGDVEGAMKSYETAVALDPRSAYANYNLGKLLYTRGALERSERLLRSALEHKPEFPEANVALSNLYDAQGDLPAAAAALEAALEQRPGYFGALYNYAIVLRKLGRWPDAESALRRAVAADANDADAVNLLGSALARQGRLEEAAFCYRKALAIDPDLPGTLCDLGNVLCGLGQPEEAAACYRKAIALEPGLAEAHSNLGNVLKDEGGLDDALACYRRALALNPEFVEARHNLCMVLCDQGRPADAIACLRETLARHPDFAQGYLSLGNVLSGEHRLDEAADCFQKALTLAPDLADAHLSLGNVHKDRDRLDEALGCYRKALSLDPENVQARWSIAMSQFPAVYEADADPGANRLAFSREIEDLDRWIDAGRRARGFKVVGTQTPFYLTYQEENNRELLSRYGSLCVRIMSDWFDRQHLARSDDVRSRDVVHVGVVSRHFQNHSVWSAIVKGWFQRLDRERFALHAFYLGSDSDQETRLAQSLATHFDQGNRNLHRWVGAIVNRRLDVLIYPEIIMDPMTVKLASLRLAPVQVTTWGHPETSGLPTIDCFLSAQAMEPERADANYTERLLMLPNLGCHYRPLRIPPARADLLGLGIDTGDPVLICPGTPFKYAPRHDRIFVEIARRLGHCRFVFFMHRPTDLSEKLRDRIRAVLARNGVDAEKVLAFVPMQNTAEFHGLLGRAHVLLDTIGFSGFNTAIQAVECGLPIVTREGRFLRGRLASGILKRMGLQELVAATEENYVELAVTLCRDAEYRAHIRGRIEAGRHALFEDPAPIRALEEFLARAATRR